MRFGLLYEHQLPRPWGPTSEHDLLQQALEQVEIADRAGFDTVWAVEHHFLEEYSHSSASDVFLAACSQRAPRIRLGFGILPLPPGYQHPARVAETVATLDLISGGRVELGTGETSSGAELGGFGVPRELKRAAWEEALDVVTRMMVEEPFAGADGRFVSMPPRNVVPKPLQKPHPPLWLACSRRETIRIAAQKGVGALSFSFAEPEEAREWVDEYRAIIASERCVPGGFAVNPKVAVALPMMLHADEATAIERGIDGAHFFAYALAHYYVFGDHAPGRTSIWDEFVARRDQVGFAREAVRPGGEPLAVKVLEEGLGSLRGAIGTPEQVRDLIARYEAAGVDEMLFVVQTGRTEHAHVCEALELFGAEVLPAFAEGRDEREAARRAELDEACARALARRPAPREADPGYRVGPMDGPAPTDVVAPPEPAAPVAPARLRRAVEARGERAFRSFVARSDDRRLERTVGSGRGLKVLFGAMERAFVPDKAQGWTGEIRYDLRGADGAVRSWTVAVGPARAQARPDAAGQPSLVVKMGLADFVRMAAGDLDAGRALLSGRLDLEGDVSVAMRLGEMFGQPGAF